MNCPGVQLPSADCWTDRGALADELGHLIIAEQYATRREDLAVSVCIAPMSNALRAAGTEFPNANSANLALVKLLDRQVLSDLAISEFQTISLQRIGDDASAILLSSELNASIQSRSKSVAAGPIARSLIDETVVTHPLARAAGSLSADSRGRVQLYDAERLLTLLFFLHAPKEALSTQPHSQAIWDVVSPILLFCEKACETREVICDAAVQIQEEVEQHLLKCRESIGGVCDEMLRESGPSSKSWAAREVLCRLGLPTSHLRAAT